MSGKRERAYGMNTRTMLHAGTFGSLRRIVKNIEKIFKVEKFIIFYNNQAASLLLKEPSKCGWAA